jgi:hypothetical protein
MKHDLTLCEVLDSMADRLLPRAAVAERGLVDPASVAALRRRPSGRPYGRERIYRLWSLLLTELWSQLYLDRRGAPLESVPPAARQARAEPGRARTAPPRTGTAHG